MTDTDTRPAEEDQQTATAQDDVELFASTRRYLATPLFVAASLAVLYFYVTSKDLDSIEQRALAWSGLGQAALRHINLTLVSTVFVILIAVPLGIVLTRPFAKKATPAIITIFNTGQATPSIGVLALFAVAFVFIGYRAAVVGLVTYASLPVLRNTMVGLQQVDKSVLEAGRGMGMTKWVVLRRLEMPLAVPVILAGVRTALVINVGTATLATFVNAGGLGDVINAGLSTNRWTVQITGAVLTAALALMVDYVGGIIEDALRPKGL